MYVPVSATGDVVDGERLYLNCSVSYADYFGYLAPHYDWTVLDDSEQSPVQTISPTATSSGTAYVTASWPTVPQLLCVVYFNGSAGASYSDAASNAPSYSGDCTTNAVDVLSAPRDVHISASDVDGGRRLRCRAAGRPVPTYRWYRASGDEQLLASGDLLTVTDVGRHEVRCTAVNTIRGVTHRRSDVVVFSVLPPPRRQNDTDVITDSTAVDDVRTTAGSVNKTAVYEGNAMSGRLISSPYVIIVTCIVAVVALSIVIAVAVRCCRGKRRQELEMENEGAAATPTWTASNMEGHSQNGEPLERTDEQITDDHESAVDDESSSAIYDEIVSNSASSHPPPAESEQYNELIMSDVAPVAASGTDADVYSPLQRDANNTTTTKITISMGKCDVSIVFSGDGDAGTVPSIQRTHADSP